MTPERDSPTLIVVKFNDPIAPGLEPAFHVRVDLGPLDDYGVTRAVHRRVIPITGGLVSGGINDEILPGGADWQLARPDGTLETARSRSAGAICAPRGAAEPPLYVASCVRAADSIAYHAYRVTWEGIRPTGPQVLVFRLRELGKERLRHVSP